MTTRLGLVIAAVVGAAVIGFATCRTSDTSGSEAGGPTAAGPGGTAARGGTSDPGRGAATVEPAWFGIPGAEVRRIRGRVFLGGQPVAARLALASAATDAGAVAITSATAGADGGFDLGPHRAGVYRLLAIAPGAEPRLVAVDCSVADAEVEVFLVPCRRTVGGEVRDASGGAIAGASISTAGFELATTDAAGRYDVCAGDDAEALVARADGYAAAERQIHHGAATIDFELVPEATVIARVVDSAGAPVAGAVVRATPAIDASDDGQVPASGVTDAGGRVELRALAPSTYDVVATAAEQISPVVPHDPVPGAAAEIELVLAAAATVRGRITEANAPVAALRVRWIVDEREAGRAVSGADGTFAITGIAPGAGAVELDPSITVIAPVGAGAAEATVTPGPPIELEIQRPHHIRGTVTHAGRPVGGVGVRILNRLGGETTSAADGTFELAFRGAAPDARITAESRALGAFGIANVALGAADVTGVVIDLEWSAAVAGVVVDEAGAPIPGVVVRVVCAASNDAGEDITARDGTFTARQLRGGCRYVPRLRLDSAELDPATAPGSGAKPAWPELDVPTTGTLDGVRLVARVVRNEVTGIVVDAAGAPVPDALVVIAPGVRDTRTAVDGRFTVGSLHPGPYRIEARASGMRSAMVADVVAGTTDLRIVLEAPGTAVLACAAGVEGRLVLASMRHGRRRGVRCGQTVTSLPVGPYVILGTDIAAQFAIAAGATTEVPIAPVGRTDVDVIVKIPPGVEPPVPVVCHAGWMYVPGEMEMEPAVPIVDGKVRLSARRGFNRVMCRAGIGLRGEVRTQIGADPVTLTVKLVVR
jgi:hypothetical protein